MDSHASNLPEKFDESIGLDQGIDFDTAWNEFMNEQQQLQPVEDSPEQNDQLQLIDQQDHHHLLLNSQESNALNRFLDTLIDVPVGYESSYPKIDEELQKLSGLVTQEEEQMDTSTEFYPAGSDRANTMSAMIHYPKGQSNNEISESQSANQSVSQSVSPNMTHNGTRSGSLVQAKNRSDDRAANYKGTYADREYSTHQMFSNDQNYSRNEGSREGSLPRSTPSKLHSFSAQVTNPLYEPGSIHVGGKHVIQHPQKHELNYGNSQAYGAPQTYGNETPGNPHVRLADPNQQEILNSHQKVALMQNSAHPQGIPNRQIPPPNFPQAYPLYANQQGPRDPSVGIPLNIPYESPYNPAGNMHFPPGYKHPRTMLPQPESSPASTSAESEYLGDSDSKRRKVLEENSKESVSRQNHVLSEQRRRGTIKELYSRMCDLVPEVKRAKGTMAKSNALYYVHKHLEYLASENKRIRELLISKDVKCDHIPIKLLDTINRDNVEFSDNSPKSQVSSDSRSVELTAEMDSVASN